MNTNISRYRRLAHVQRFVCPALRIYSALISATYCAHASIHDVNKPVWKLIAVFGAV